MIYDLINFTVNGMALQRCVKWRRCEGDVRVTLEWVAFVVFSCCFLLYVVVVARA